MHVLSGAEQWQILAGGDHGGLRKTVQVTGPACKAEREGGPSAWDLGWVGPWMPEALGLALLAPAFLLWHPVVKAFPAPVCKVRQFSQQP